MRPSWKTYHTAATAGVTAAVLLLVVVLPWGGPAHPDGTAFAGQGPLVFPQLPQTLSPTIPAEVEFEEQEDEEKNRPFIDDFAWRNFIALNWPADENQRGVPHPTKKFGDTSGPVLWGSWKSVGELFPADPVKDPPTPWESFDALLAAPRVGKDRKREVVPFKNLPAREAGKTKVLARLSKLEDINQAGLGDLEFPLVAQNRSFVRYEIRVNRLEYDFVRDRQLYLRKNLPQPETPLEFPDQSVTVKAAWRELPDDESVRQRFYSVRAKVVDWGKDGTPVLTDRTVGLVGLHVVHKTPKRRNWAWATFEHVDNTERSPGGISPPSFNSKDEGMKFTDPGTNVNPKKIEVGKPIPKDPQPVEVARKTPVHPTTEKINDAYRGHAQIKGTVWRNYRLVVTQWPSPPGDGPPSARFPKNNVANVTMETYHQGSGCMNCHAVTASVKFVFYPDLRAVDVSAAPTTGAPEAAKRIRKLLETELGKPQQK